MYPFAAVLLTVVTALAVYDPSMFWLSPEAQMVPLFVTVPLAVLLIWKWTKPKAGGVEREIALFAAWADGTPGIRDAAESSVGYRTAPKQVATTKITIEKLPPPTVKSVPALPTELAAVLDLVGGGTPATFFEVHPKIAYIAIMGADAGTVSEYTSIVLKLDAPAPTLELRPLIAGDPLPARAVGFKDEEFGATFVVEGEDPKAVRAFFIPELREDLLDHPTVHVHVLKRALSVTQFGPFDRARAAKLMDLADAFFAEYGADEGPALRAPFEQALADAEAALAGVGKKKKKKKKAPPIDGDAATET